MIDKNSPIPLYFQLKEIIGQCIEDNTFVAGDILPSENELVEKYKISRMTVKQALDSLAAEGSVTRIKGKGTFVAEKKIEQNVLGLTGFSEDMVLRGMKPSSAIIENRQITAPQNIAKILSTNNVNLIKRIRSADGCPLGIEESYIPTSTLPVVSNSTLESSLYDYLENVLNKKISYAKQSLEASVVSKETAELLNIDEGAPVLILNRTTVLDDGTPFEFTRTIFRGDRYKYIVELKR